MTKDEELFFDLFHYCDSLSPLDIYNLLDWLADNRLLSLEGEDFKHAFWAMFISKDEGDCCFRSDENDRR